MARRLLINSQGKALTLSSKALFTSDTMAVTTTWTGSQASYDALSSKSRDTLYLIEGSNNTYIKAYLGTKPLCFFSGTPDTITGYTTLTFFSEMGGKIVALVRYGKCEQRNDPSPSAPMDIWTNNGALRYGKPLTLNTTRYYAYIDSLVGWKWINESYSIAIPVTVGKKYKIELSTTESSLVGTILRYCFVDNVYDTWKQGETSPTPNTIAYYNTVRTTPQNYVPTELMAEHPYLIIQMAVGNFASILTNGYLTVKEQTVYADGTPEVLYVTDGKNLFPPYAVVDELYPVEFSATTNVSASAKCASSVAEIRYYDASKTQIDYYTLNRDAGNGRWGYTFNISARAKYISISRKSGYPTAEVTDLQLEFGAEMTPYVTPQTASVPTLLGVGDYKDEAEIINGIKTGKVGVKVFDGTEDWKNISGYYNLSKTDLNTNSTVLPLNSTSIICTHFVTKMGMFTDGIGVGESYVNFKYDTVAATLNEWKAYLAAQYAAGTPVIVIYPLATPTTESATAQEMTEVVGSNTVEITANVSDPKMTITYID